MPANGKPTFLLKDDEMEYGVGHHGEAGIEKTTLTTVDEVVDRMAAQIIEDLPFNSGDEIVLMINGLGGTPQCELYLAYRKARQVAEAHGMKVAISMVGEFFTGLEMGGLSVTYSRLDDEIKELLQYPANTCMYKVI